MSLYDDLEADGLIDHTPPPIPTVPGSTASQVQTMAYVVAITARYHVAGQSEWLQYLGDVAWGPNSTTTKDLAGATLFESKSSAEDAAIDYGADSFLILPIREITSRKVI